MRNPASAVDSQADGFADGLLLPTRVANDPLGRRIWVSPRPQIGTDAGRLAKQSFDEKPVPKQELGSEGSTGFISCGAHPWAGYALQAISGSRPFLGNTSVRLCGISALSGIVSLPGCHVSAAPCIVRVRVCNVSIPLCIVSVGGCNHYRGGN